MIEGEIPEKNFAHFFIDPFDMGHPPIQSETVSICLKRPNTELVLFFPWEQVVSRLAGYVGIEEPEDTHITGMESLTSLYFGDESWKKIEHNLPSQKKRTTEDKIKRRQKYVELYKEKLETIFKGVNYVEIPMNSDRPKYFLFFAANQITQPQIFMNQVDRTRKRKMNMKQRKQPQKLDSFLKLGETHNQVRIPPKKIKLPKWRNTSIFQKIIVVDYLDPKI